MAHAEARRVSAFTVAHPALSDSAHRCAYWTFVPLIKTTCGTYTRRDTIWEEDGSFFYPPLRYVFGCNNPRSFSNVCVSQPVEQHGANEDKYKKAGKPRSLWGEYRAVRVDCYTGQKLVEYRKDEIMSHEGVALPDDWPYRKALTQIWKDQSQTDPHSYYAPHGKILCDHGGVPRSKLAYTPDCIDALGALRRSGDKIFTGHEYTTVAVSLLELLETLTWTDLVTELGIMCYRGAAGRECQRPRLPVQVSRDRHRDRMG